MESEPRINTKWFQRQLERADMSQRRLAELINLPPSAVSLLLNGKRSLRSGEAVRIAEALRVPLEEVMAQTGAPVIATRDGVPVAAVFDAAGELSPRKAGKRVLRPGRLPGSAVAARCEDPQAIYFGWTIFYTPVRDVTSEAIGKLSVVETPGGHTLLRFVKHGWDGGSFQLVSLAGELTEDVVLASASPVLLVKP